MKEGGGRGVGGGARWSGIHPRPLMHKAVIYLVWNHGIRNVEGRADHQGIGFSRVSQCT